MAEATETTKRRSGKSSAAFRTISEVAERLDVPQHVLRFWETKFGQVRPLKRGGGRRYYRPEDVDLLERIRSLLYDEGYTIKGVQRLLREGGGKAPAPAASAETSGGEEKANSVGAEAPAPAPALSSSQRDVLVDLQNELKDLQDLLAKLAN